MADNANDRRDRLAVVAGVVAGAGLVLVVPEGAALWAAGIGLAGAGLLARGPLWAGVPRGWTPPGGPPLPRRPAARPAEVTAESGVAPGETLPDLPLPSELAHAPSTVEAPPPGPPRVTAAWDVVALPGGSFLQGSPDDEAWRWPDEGPRQNVSIAPFRMARTPVTVALYQEVVGGEVQGDPDLPATGVSWFDAIHFCNRLSLRLGLPPAYDDDHDAGSHVGTLVDTRGVRLPTEAEWEYACRAGTETPWSVGASVEALADVAWLAPLAVNTPRPVGKLAANAFGLHDMHGNVWEWCWDPYSSYGRAPEGKDRRVVRGAAYWNGPWDARSASRRCCPPGTRAPDIGFRFVLPA